MSLRKKTLAIIGVTIVGLILILYASARIIMLGSFAKLEEQNTHRSVERALGALSEELSSLDALARDVASWDRTVAFVEDRNEEYVRSNLSDGVFIQNKLNALIYVNSAGRIVFAKEFDLHLRKEKSAPIGLQGHLGRNAVLFGRGDPKNGAKGLLLLSDGPMLVASRPILTGEQAGPPRGWVVVGRRLEFSIVQELGEQTRLSLAMCLFSDPNLPPDFEEAKAGLSRQRPTVVRPLGPGSIAGYALVSDVYGKPILLLRVDAARDIYEQGRASLRQAMLSLLWVGLIFGVLTLLLLEKLVLSRLAHLSRSVSRIGAKGDPSARVSTTGNDELSGLANDINGMLVALEHSEEALRESAERYRALVETSPDAISMTDLDGNFIMANRQAAFLHGFDSVEDLLSNIHSVFDLIAPEDRPRARENTQKTLTEKSINNVEYTLLRKDGTSFPAELSSAVIPNAAGGPAAFIGIVRDITGRKRSERQLAESERKYRTLFEDSLEAMSLTRQGKIVDVNAAWLALHGFSRKEEVVGMDVLRVVHPDEQSALQNRRTAGRRLPRRLHQTRDVKANGTVIDVELYSSSITLGGEDAIITTVRDITDRKRAERELKESYRRLQETQTQLVQAGKMAAVGQLAAGVAHEINNPLAIISSSSEILSDLMQSHGSPLPGASASVKKHLKKIEDSIFRCKSIIDDLLGFARREEEDLEEVDLAGLLKETMRLVEGIAKSRDRHLLLTGRPLPKGTAGFDQADIREMEKAPLSPLPTRTWPRQIQQVFLNLILNALDATKPGETIVVSAAHKDGGIEAAVADTGTGILPEHLEHVFEPFFTTKPVGKGTGLGLYLSHQIVESLEGTLTVESEPNKGTTMRVWLPAASPAASHDHSSIKASV